MDSLVFGEHYGSPAPTIPTQSNLQRTCSLSKSSGLTGQLSSCLSSTSSSFNNNNNPNDFVTVVEVDENLKKIRQQEHQKVPFNLVNGGTDVNHHHHFNQQLNHSSSMIMSTSTIKQQTVNNGSTIEPFVTVLEVGNPPIQNGQTRDIGATISANNVVITSNNHVNNKNDYPDESNTFNRHQIVNGSLDKTNGVHRYTTKTKTLLESVTVYRLPGERLGMTLKFDGGANLDETIANLYIQNINPDSPASRISGSVLGRLCEGDEILEISGDPVNTMTRKECVAALGDAPICFKMLIKRQETVSITETATPAITPPTQPVQPAHIPVTATLSSPVEQFNQQSSSSTTSEVDYHKATLRRVDSENVLTPPTRTRRQPPPVPPRNSTTSLTSGSSFRSPIKPPARKRPSQPPPLPPRRSKATSGETVPARPAEGQNCQPTLNGETIIQTGPTNSSVLTDSNQMITCSSSIIVDCGQQSDQKCETFDNNNKPFTSSVPIIDNMSTISVTNLKLDNCDSNDLSSSSSSSSFASPMMGTPYLNGTSEMIIQGIKTVEDKFFMKEQSMDRMKNSYEQHHYNHHIDQQSLPAPPELYMDTISSKTNLGIESDSDDTGSSVSTVVERFSFTSYSCSPSDSTSSIGVTSSNNSNYRLPVTGSNIVTSSSPSSTATNTINNPPKSSSSSSVNFIDAGKVLDPFEKLRREFDEKGSLEELIAEAKSGFSLDNLIHEKIEPRLNQSSGLSSLTLSSKSSSSSTTTTTTTTTINGNSLSTNPSSSPCSFLGPPTHQAPSPPIPSFPSLSPSRYEVNLDDYDDIQSISLTYEANNSTNSSTTQAASTFCEPIVEPPKSFSNNFPSIREEEGESSSANSSLEYHQINRSADKMINNPLDESSNCIITSNPDAAIAAADSVTLDAQEILSIVENMKLDEDLSLIPSISDPMIGDKSKMRSYCINEETVPGNVSIKSLSSSVNGHSPLSASSSSSSSTSSSTLPIASEVLSSSTDDEDKPVQLQQELRVSSSPPSSTTVSPYERKAIIHSYELHTNGNNESKLSEVDYNDDDSRMINGNGMRHLPGSRNSSICSNSSSDSSYTPTGSTSSSSSSSSSDPRSSPARLNRSNKLNTNRSGTGSSVKTLIPKMVELPSRTLTSRSLSSSSGLLARKSKSTLNLSSFADFDSKPSLIPRPIITNAKSTTNLSNLNGFHTISRFHNHSNSNGYTGNHGNNGTGVSGNGYHNHHHHQLHNNNNQQQSINGPRKNGSIIRRSKSIENMRSLTYNVSTISSLSSSTNGHHQTNGNRRITTTTGTGGGEIESFGRSQFKPKDYPSIQNHYHHSAKTIESNNHLNHLHHSNGSSINRNHNYYHNNISNGQSKASSHSSSNNVNRKSSLARCTEKNLFETEFTRSKSSLTSSSAINTLSSPLLSSSSASSSSVAASLSSTSSSSASSTASSSSPPPSSTSPSLSSSSSSSSSLSSNGNHHNHHQYNHHGSSNQHYHQTSSTHRMIDLKIDLSDDEKDDIKELEELEEFIAREMKCKSESDDFLADELFTDSFVNTSKQLNASTTTHDSLNNNGYHNHEPDVLDKSLESSFSSNSKILTFPTIPEEQEDHPSLEMINGDNHHHSKQSEDQSKHQQEKEENQQFHKKKSNEHEEVDGGNKQTNGTLRRTTNGHLKEQNKSLENGHKHDNNYVNGPINVLSEGQEDNNRDDQHKNLTNSRVKYMVFTKIIDL